MIEHGFYNCVQVSFSQPIRLSLHEPSLCVYGNCCWNISDALFVRTFTLSAGIFFIRAATVPKTEGNNNTVTDYRMYTGNLKLEFCGGLNSVCEPINPSRISVQKYIPGLGKNWLMKRLGNLYSLIRVSVSSKSSSDSVGNPQMISVAMVIPGTCVLR